MKFNKKTVFDLAADVKRGYEFRSVLNFENLTFEN